MDYSWLFDVTIALEGVGMGGKGAEFFSTQLLNGQLL